MDELRFALELATEKELETLAELLFRPQLNPLDYLNSNSWQGFQDLSWGEQVDRLEDRLRYLAADGFTVLQGRSDRISYRQILLQVCRHLKMTPSAYLSTEDLEAEVFLHILETAWKRMSPQEQKTLNHQVHQALVTDPQYPTLPRSLRENPLGLLAKGGSALAVNGVVRPWLLQQIAHQFALHLARQQIARQALSRGGLGIAGQIHNRVAVTMAGRGMALNAARYGAVRGVFAVVGPALWVWFFADLGWRTIATNYGRVIPAVFTLAQIRLTRGVAPIPDYELAQY